jgi:hypothetical protein
VVLQHTLQIETAQFKSQVPRVVVTVLPRTRGASKPQTKKEFKERITSILHTTKQQQQIIPMSSSSFRPSIDAKFDLLKELLEKKSDRSLKHAELLLENILVSLVGSYETTKYSSSQT